MRSAQGHRRPQELTGPPLSKSKKNPLPRCDARDGWLGSYFFYFFVPKTSVRYHQRGIFPLRCLSAARSIFRNPGRKPFSEMAALGAASKAMRIFFAICAIAIAGVVTAGETASEVECADEALPQIAFLILVHNEDTLGGAARLIDALYDRDHTFFVHFDTKMPRREVRLYKERHIAVPNRTPLV